MLMLLDLNMPKKNGFDVLAWVRSQRTLKRLTIVVLTASLRTQDLDRAFDLGASAFLVKPSEISELADMLQTLWAWVQFCHFPRLTTPLSEPGNQWSPGPRAQGSGPLRN